MIMVLYGFSNDGDEVEYRKMGGAGKQSYYKRRGTLKSNVRH